MRHTLIMATVLAALTVVAQIAAAADGQAIYDKSCKGCHDKGLMGSPKTGDKDKWAPLIKSGVVALEASVMNGKGKMKPKGGNDSLTAEDIKASVDYIISKSQ
ncbi:MAG: cytochrome c5 family protein [Betaproteobacteria bacterium]|nr:cytochrome c5 family protein [Betaproteobacteria bacterium]